MSVSFISKSDYIENYKSQSGSSLIFQKELHDITHYVKSVNKKIYPMGADTKKSNILRVLVYNDYNNVSNTNVVYKTPVCCRYSDEGAFFLGGISFTKHPLGDVIVVLKNYDKPKKKIYITDDDF